MNDLLPPLVLEELTWTDVEHAIERGYRRAVFAVGATEQHGPHLPLLVDAAIGTDLAHRVARSLGATFVAPTLRIGCSEHHMSFPGTLSVEENTLRALVTDVAVSLARHGLDEVLILPSHGGNFAPIRTMLSDVQAAARDASPTGRVRVWAFTRLAKLVETWRHAIAERGGPAERVGGHADIAESSILLTLHRPLVHEDRAEPGYAAEITDETYTRIIANGLHSVSANGILGDARGMSSELGEACQEAVTALIVDAYREASGDGD